MTQIVERLKIFFVDLQQGEKYSKFKLESLMDWIRLSRVLTVAFVALATALNWPELENIIPVVDFRNMPS
jgi:hypothetical protein